MTGHEHEPEEVIPHGLVERRFWVNSLSSPLDLAADLVMLALESLAAADEVESAMLRRPHQPGPRSLRHS